MASRQLDEEAIFHVARKIDDTEARQAYLDQICAGDLGLRNRVEGLLKVHNDEKRFLNSSPEPAPTIDQPLITERPGTTIGRYHLREQIGEGGMGIVFVAEQQRPIQRKVALKVIKPGMDSKAVIARFDVERQALAMMDHPNIAKVLDAGTTDSGRPYFVMELVRGTPITEYCDENKLSIAERLELFTQVCQAIQHAHQKGIIHRDIKPTNVMVTLHDDKPIIKVIDFGVAKAISQRLTEQTVYTGFAQAIGTPLYMSPEQAGASGLDIDTRTDIYSLGVLLYELLTGTTPFDKQELDKAAYEEVRRIIREEEPTRPSVKISTLGATLQTVSAQRRMDPQKLCRFVRGDLDWIVMKALEKDRTRRYDSAISFSHDVDRYLNNEPVTACPPSTTYRLRKFVRRNRMFVTASTISIVALVLVLGISVGNLFLLEREHRQTILAKGYAVEQQRIAQDQRDRADAARVVAEAETSRAMAAQRAAEDNLYRADIQRTMIALQDGNRREAERLLRQNAQTGQLDFEWCFLRDLCRKSRPAKEFQTTGNSVAGDLSADGRLLAVCQTNGILCVIDTQSGLRTEWPLRGRPRWWQNESYVSFAPDCHHIAYPADDPNAASIRNVETGDVYTLSGDTYRLTTAVFCPLPHSEFLATGDASGTIRLWNWVTRTVVAQAEHQDCVQKLAWSADGQLLVSSGEKDIRVWDSNLKQIQMFQPADFELPLRVFDIALAPNGKSVAVAPGDHTVRVWDLDSGKPTATFSDHTSIVHAVRFVSDTMLVSAGRDNAIRFWNLQTHRQENEIWGHSAYVWWLAGPASDGWLTSGGLDGNVMLWQTSPPDNGDTIVFNADQIRQVALSPDERTLAAVVQTWYPERDQAGEVLLMDTDDLTQRRTLPVDYFVQSVAFSSDGALGCGGGPVGGDEWKDSGSVTIWRSLTDTAPKIFTELPGRVQNVQFSPNGQVLAATCVRGCVILHVTDGQCQKLSASEHGFDGLAWSPDCRYVAAGSMGFNFMAPKLVVWDAETGHIKFDSAGADDHTESVRCVAISLDGKLLASGGNDGQIQLRDMETGQRIGVIDTHSGFVWSLVFSRDGRRLFSSSGDDTINIWDLERKELRLSFPAHTDGTKSLLLSQDETFLVSGGLWDGTLRIWHAPRQLTSSQGAPPQ